MFSSTAKSPSRSGVSSARPVPKPPQVEAAQYRRPRLTHRFRDDAETEVSVSGQTEDDLPGVEAAGVGVRAGWCVRGISPPALGSSGANAGGTGSPAITSLSDSCNSSPM
jgi:hypothetical protein